MTNRPVMKEKKKRHGFHRIFRLARVVRLAGLGAVCTHAALFMVKGSTSFMLEGVYADQPVRFGWTIERLVSSPGAEESYAPVNKGDGLVDVERTVRQLDEGAYEVRFLLRNRSGTRLFIRVAGEVEVPFAVQTWWNGHLDEPSVPFNAENPLSAWFPANAALGAERGVALGVNPRRIYSRVDSGRRTEPGAAALTLAIPCVLDASGELATFELSFVVAGLPARYGYREVVQRYYDLFPEAYQPASDIHPGVQSTQFYLLRNPNQYRDGLYLEDLARRFSGGQGAWEWWYAPFIRGGDWASTYEWTEGWKPRWTRENIDLRRQTLNGRLDRALAANVAPMYYVNVRYGEKELVETHFSDALLDENAVTNSFWSQEVLTGLYPYGNSWGDLFASGVRGIAAGYPSARGIGWDSTFGHEIVSNRTAGVEITPERSFRRGNIFALTGAAFAHLFDLNRSLYNGGYRMANCVNLKLVSPYFLGARADTVLFEGAPMERPERMMRVEALRTRLGTGKTLTWHKYSLPEDMVWIQWDSLTPEQIRDAYRQVQDDTLFMSYFWGAVPVPGTPALGMERLFHAVPELISLARQGWQPVPGADTPNGILAVRFGRGAGARLVLINPDFQAVEEAEIFLPASYWDGGYPLLVREDGQSMDGEAVASGVRVTLRMPAREVIVLRAAGLAVGTAPEAPVRIHSQYLGELRGHMTWSWTLSSPSAFSWETVFFNHPDAIQAELEGTGLIQQFFASGQPIQAVLNADVWPQQAGLFQGDFHLGQDKRIVSGSTASRLRSINPVPEGPGERTVVVIPDPALSHVAEPILNWYRFYTHHALDDLYEPQVVSEIATDGVSLLLEIRSDLLAADQDGRWQATNDGIVKIWGRDAAALGEAVQAFLLGMDEAYPHVGVIVKNDTHLERAGLIGSVLTAAPQTAPVVGPTLLEHMRNTRLID